MNFLIFNNFKKDISVKYQGPIKPGTNEEIFRNTGYSIKDYSNIKNIDEN